MQNQNNTICFFNSAIAWGGGEKWHFDMAVALQKKGYNILFFANEKSELSKRLKDSKIKTIKLKVTNLSFLNPFKINFVKTKLNEHNAETIIINLSQDLKLAGFAAKKAVVKNIVYRRGSAIPIKNSILNRFIFKNIVTNILANTEATKKTINENNPNLFNPEKIKVIYNGINIENLFNKKAELLYNKQPNEIVIGNLGRLEKQKAQYLILDLAKELKTRNVADFKILIAGSGSLEAELKENCKKNKLCNEVIFTGFVKNVKAFYNTIDIFVLSSLWEGFGYVLAEAMAFKKPVVAFDISSNPEIVEDNVTGYLIDFPNIKTFADKVENLINNPQLRKGMGQNGKKRTEKLFLIENQINEVEKFILSF